MNTTKKCKTSNHAPCRTDFFMPNSKEHEKTNSFLEEANAMDQS